MRSYSTRKLTKVDGEYILWHVLGFLQYLQTYSDVLDTTNYHETEQAMTTCRTLLSQFRKAVQS